MITIIMTLMLATLPPVNPLLPLVKLKTVVSATSNTAISSSITLASPKSVGYSPWFGVFQSFNGILTTIAPTPGGGGSSLPGAAVTGGTVINRGIN